MFQMHCGLCMLAIVVVIVAPTSATYDRGRERNDFYDVPAPSAQRDSSSARRQREKRTLDNLSLENFIPPIPSPTEIFSPDFIKNEISREAPRDPKNIQNLQVNPNSVVG